VTAYDQPALGGVYKLAAIRGASGWEYRIKLSQEPAKVSNPGVQQVRRFAADRRFVGDLIVEEELGAVGEGVTVDGAGPWRAPAGASSEELLQPALRAGQAVYASPPLAEIRAQARAQLEMLDPAVRRLKEPERYPVALDRNLADLKARVMAEAREG
jgi:nicotinate phosphoribosyltransferase